MGRQDAVETDEDAASTSASPPVQQTPSQQHKRHSLRPSGTALSLNVLQRDIKEAFSRRCSSLRRRPAPQPPKLKHAASVDAGGHQDPVSILVTEPSPESAAPPGPRPTLTRQQSEATVVHVLVHRESEEYRDDEEQQPKQQQIPEEPDEHDDGAS